MLRLKEVASQSETFVKRALEKAKTSREVNRLMGPPAGLRLEVFSLDRPPLLAVMRSLRSRHQAFLTAHP